MLSDSAQTEAYRNAIYNNLHQMSCMKESVLIEEKIASNLAEILHLDLTTCKVEDVAEFYLDFEFEINCDCKITAIGGCFDLMSC